jgi:excinuclease ABC subunit C
MVNFKDIPHNPGCYLFKDKDGKVIYVGKAKDLRKRVSSYFNKTHDVERTNILVSKVVKVDFVVTDTEAEALILENNLIKKYSPKYNIDLKDSKRYAYIQLTDEEFPRLLLARKKGGGGKFYGPFVSGLGRDYVLRVLRNTFRIRTCRKLPRRKCMRYDIGLCDAPCIGEISREDYMRNVKSAEMILKGKVKPVVEILDKKMRMFSRAKEFEKALVVRNQIRAVKELGERQKMERDKKFDEDFINWIVHDDKVYLILFNAKRGILENKQSFEFDYFEDFIEEFLVQFYSDYDVPKEIVLPVKVGRVVREFLEEKGGKVVLPKSGDKKKLLELVKKNVEIGVFGDSEKVSDLRDRLRLNSLPRVIECFDVSHLGGTDVVASMVQFRDGKSDKNNYRRFKIRGGDVNDDFAAMSEVVRRRYTKLKREDLEMPDLIIVDGGKGQLGVALDELKELDLKIPIIGLAKKEEEVFLPGRKRGIVLGKKTKALRFLQEIRDEAHRFAINYQRMLRSRKIRE